MRIPLILALLVLVPAAAAQSADKPNLQDASGDQNPPGPASQWADLRRGWMVEDDQGLRFTLEVATLASTDSAQFEVTWFRTSTSEENVTAMGFGVAIDAGQTQAYLVEPSIRDACAARQQPLGPKGAASAQVKTGTPGRIEWSANPSDLKAQPGDRFFNFCAYSYVRMPLGGVVNADVARTVGNQALNHTFQVGLRDTIREGAFAIDPTAPFIDDHDDDETPSLGSYDIEAFQLHVGDVHVNATLRLRSLSWQELDGRPWFLSLSMRQYNPYGPGDVGEQYRSNIFVRNGTLRFASVDHEQNRIGNDTNQPSSLFVQLGTPGYVRASIPRDEWLLPTVLEGVTVFAFLAPPDQTVEGDQYYVFPERYFDLPVPPAVLFAAVAGAAWLRRRQR